ncbi:hypothetical protein E4665_13445 [Sporolactobacillus shoreae]|uniref:YpoC-like domain-containing protein n=1 Tax=Sporolactobacillus shoreae TaxID=1465501 RepID=A0A4Z0GJP6_9BACL|nr:hypothetical protein [Sporolactobacillus shoreae]TGA97039.1 hypothetical protein E4665_13445 [Sporolactobacillus shoreae]
MENNVACIQVPESFCFPPFYGEEASLIKQGPSSEVTQYPFYYDIMYHIDPSSCAPWPWETETDYLRASWEKRRPAIRDTFHRRSANEARTPMILSLAEFIDQMFWVSGQPVRSLSPDQLITGLQSFAYAPLNLKERLGYIIDQPDRYLSFIQLNELQDELKKKLSVYRKQRQ